MRYAIIADIHANLAAFKAVLNDIERQGGVEELWCLGDIVGYGPDPSQCIELLRQYKHVCVIGNHDMAVIGKLNITELNPEAAVVCRWTEQQLSTEDIDYLGNLPSVIEKDNFTLVHGSPRQPVREYLMSISGANENFSYFKTQFCLVGHSHIPALFRYRADDTCLSTPLMPNIKVILGKNRFIINPGSVGQPRDNDPRASYAIYDDGAEMIIPYRVRYDTSVTQDRMAQCNLPVRLVARLGKGR
ncbi:MAG: metallophosphoesterase family protein [Dehalococcoidales bacterium]|nr:metallophosphoesterase family protein [Dehalococcoidales bacterium]